MDYQSLSKQIMNSLRWNSDLLRNVFLVSFLLQILIHQSSTIPPPRNYRVNGGTFMLPQHPDADPYRSYAEIKEVTQNEDPIILRSLKLRRAAMFAAKNGKSKPKSYDQGSSVGTPVLGHDLNDLEQLSIARAKREALPQVQISAPEFEKLIANGSLSVGTDTAGPSGNATTTQAPATSTATAARSSSNTTSGTTTANTTSASTTAKQAPPAPTPAKTAHPVLKGGELYLPEDYNALEIPKSNIGKAYGLEIFLPLPCVIYLNMLGVTEIEELSEKISFDADLTVEWVDGNLFDYSKIKQTGQISKQMVLKADRILSPIFLSKVWRPDLVMEDLVKVEQPTITNKAVIGLKFNTLTGFFSYTVRMSITVNCPMSFEYYPADTQECVFQFKSYSYPNREMTLDWLATGVFLRDASESNFDLKVERVWKEVIQPEFNNPLNDSFDSLHFNIRARRKLSYHLVQTYLPSVFHIFITWLVFLIPSTMYDLRVGTTMTTLLTLTSMFSSVREAAPVVNYVKAVDLWMITCVFFVFLNLVELTLLTWLRVTAEGIQEKLDKAEDEVDENGKAKVVSRSVSKSRNIQRHRMERMLTAFNFMEDYSFCIFAVLFVVFNICYWTWLLTASGYFTWDPSSEFNAVEL